MKLLNLLRTLSSVNGMLLIDKRFMVKTSLSKERQSKLDEQKAQCEEVEGTVTPAAISFGALWPTATL